MGIDIQRQRLAAVGSYAELRRLRDELRPLNGPDLFLALFQIAVDYQGGRASDNASSLLVDLEPPCPMSCEEVLRHLARASWNPSDRLVPFYLITQFGKRELLRSIEAHLAAAGPGGMRSGVEGIRYWAELPTVSLVLDYLEGQWREWRDNS